MNKRFALVVAALAVALFVVSAPAQAASDTWITTKAKIAMLTTDGVSATEVHVDTKDGNVILHGKVETDAEKAKAEDLVGKIDGVKSVKNLLQVVPKSQKEMVQQSDEQIEEKVQAAFKSNGVKDVKVQSVDKGVVLLSGKSDSLGSALMAIETAGKVPGVRRVASQIETPEK